MKKFLSFLVFSLIVFQASAQCNISASVDTIRACDGSQINLNATGGTSYTWSGSTNLSCTSCPNPTYTAQAGDTLIVSSNTNVSSLVVNGDFSQGNTGFTSAYIYNPTTIWNEGTYAVGPNPNAVHPNFGTWGDHTTGTGNYMLVNGSTGANQNLWQQTVTLPPGAQVTMSLWVLTFVTPPGSMQISMNNQVLGASFSTPNAAGIWLQRFRSFTVPPSGVCQLRIITLSNSLAGNDFGLDDIMLSYGCVDSDTVYVEIEEAPVLKASPLKRIGCDSLCVQWSNLSNLPPNQATYWWDYGDGSPLDTSYSAAHCYSSPGIYYPKLYGQSGLACSAQEDLAPVIIVPSPQIRAEPSDTIGCDALCVNWRNTSGLDSSFFTFAWDYGDGTALDTTFNGSHCYLQIGSYQPTLYVTRNDSFACTKSLDLNTIRVEQSPSLSLGDLTGGEWSGSTYLLEPESPLVQMQWQVSASISNMQVDWGDGAVETVMLQSDGSYRAEHIYTTPDQYEVCAWMESSLGCIDSICTNIDFWPSVDVPNVFSPNGDFQNDLYYPRFYSTELVEWSVFNRWGIEVFRTSDAQEQWDGTHNGAELAEGVYFVEIRMESPYGGEVRAERATLHLFR